MLVTCPECNGKVSSLAPTCPHCGYPMNVDQKTIKRVEKKSAQPKKSNKRQKLPNGFGSIKRITGTKERYGVYPPTSKSEFNENGVPPTKQALCYVTDWYTGFYALLDYKNGCFDAEKYKNQNIQVTAKGDNVINQIIESYNSQQRSALNQLTFAEVYERFYADKFENSKKQFSQSTKYAIDAAYKHCKPLYFKPFNSLVTQDLQRVVDACPLKHASLELIVNLIKQMYSYAMKNNITDKDYGKYVTINIEDDDESGTPFTQKELNILWKDKDDPVTQIILTMIYTGFRIKALEKIEYNQKENYLKGGVKTKASKGRIVPVHSQLTFVNKELFKDFSVYKYRAESFYPKLKQLGIDKSIDGRKHTPHDCRHTFSWLCDEYNVDNISKHMLMGHTLTAMGVEESVYGHRNFEQLKAEIEKIKIK